MERFLDYVLRQLISFPEDLVILQETAQKTVFRLKLRQSDIGKMVGKHGQTIASLRNILASAASRIGEKATLEIIEDSPHRS